MYVVVFLKVQVFGNDKESEQSEEGGGLHWELSPANSRGHGQTMEGKVLGQRHVSSSGVQARSNLQEKEEQVESVL